MKKNDIANVFDSVVRGMLYLNREVVPALVKEKPVAEALLEARANLRHALLTMFPYVVRDKETFKYLVESVLYPEYFARADIENAYELLPLIKKLETVYERQGELSAEEIIEEILKVLGEDKSVGDSLQKL